MTRSGPQILTIYSGFETLVESQFIYLLTRYRRCTFLLQRITNLAVD